MSSPARTDESDESVELAERLRAGWFGFWEPASHYLTRAVLLRALGSIYFVAFFSLARQLPGLIGSHGVLPASAFLERLRSAPGAPGFWRLPSLFWFGSSDALLSSSAWLGALVSLFVVAGYANAPVLAGLWLLYLSFVHIGQVFYGYGWEILLLETGFLAIFLAPPWSLRALSAPPPPAPVIWLYRWLVFRVMFGAGLIKIRGDACWTDLTCLAYHYETQPNPNPLSWFLHHAPLGFHKAGVLFNHFVELIVPWGVFGPRRVRHAAGGLIIVFQVVLILSGNLSFLNWLTIVVSLACFDDSLFERLLTARFRERVSTRIRALSRTGSSKLRRIAIGVLVAVVCVLSLNPIVNMLSPVQAMNASFEPFHLVNTYGAFGTVGKQRLEVVIEGTLAPTLDESTEWREYEFPCKPGDPRRRPCFASPYHHRLDWQMWFAALGNLNREPWLAQLARRLLEGDPSVVALLANNPFPDRPPRYVRALYYRYRFTRPGEDPGAWWTRELVGDYLRPVSLDDPELRAFLIRYRWLREP